MTQPLPVDFSAASSTRSNATALISTPAPKAMISPITRRLMRKRSAMSAPITSEDAASVPQPNDAHTYLPRSVRRTSGTALPTGGHESAPFPVN